MGNVIDLEKVTAAKEKIKSSPEVCKELNSVISKAISSTGIALNAAEAKYLLMEIIGNVQAGDAKGNWVCVFCDW